MSLRNYQLQACAQVEDHFDRGARAVCLVAPTGAGKGTMGVAIARAAARKGHVLWFTHRRELVLDASARLTAAGAPPHNVVLAESDIRHDGAMLHVGSIQTISARGAAQLPEIDFIICDECHHGVAATYRSLFQAFPRAKLLGMTATPERSDGSPLGDVFETLVVAANYSELTAMGHLVPARVIGPARCVDKLAMPVAKAVERYGTDGGCVVFARNVGHARAIASECKGVCIDASTEKSTRGAALHDFAAGKVKVLTSVHTLIEGWDCPAARVCILARKLGETAFLQAVGRVLRPHESKSSAVVVDLYGVTHQHGLPNEDREYSLTGRAVKQAEARPALRRCAACLALYRPAGVCPLCGTPPAAPAAPSVSPVALQPIRAPLPRNVKQHYFDELCRQRRVEGYRSGWIAHRFKARFGHWPDGFREMTRYYSGSKQ